jgi:hypothetical protein
MLVTPAEIAKYGGELAGLDPEALTVMATIQGNLAAAEAAPNYWAEKAARDRAAIEHAGIDEPVMQADGQAELEAAAAIDKAEADQDADLEI